MPTKIERHMAYKTLNFDRLAFRFAFFISASACAIFIFPISAINAAAFRFVVIKQIQHTSSSDDDEDQIEPEDINIANNAFSHMYKDQAFSHMYKDQKGTENRKEKEDTKRKRDKKKNKKKRKMKKETKQKKETCEADCSIGRARVRRKSARATAVTDVIIRRSGWRMTQQRRRSQLLTTAVFER
uniref:Uncharacterized protein n=1 Tax=Romanomermis culicivorax TaxID=13658 RepID=A0A915ICM1_ROMCU